MMKCIASDDRGRKRRDKEWWSYRPPKQCDLQSIRSHVCPALGGKRWKPVLLGPMLSLQQPPSQEGAGRACHAFGKGWVEAFSLFSMPYPSCPKCSALPLCPFWSNSTERKVALTGSGAFKGLWALPSQKMVLAMWRVHLGRLRLDSLKDQSNDMANEASSF